MGLLKLVDVDTEHLYLMIDNYDIIDDIKDKPLQLIYSLNDCIYPVNHNDINKILLHYTVDQLLNGVLVNEDDFSIMFEENELCSYKAFYLK